MKRNRLAWLPCVFGMLFLFGCGGGEPLPLPPDTTIKGVLAIEKDFYLRNKPEPVHISYSVGVVDISQETVLEVTEEPNEDISEDITREIAEDVAEEVDVDTSDETVEEATEEPDQDIGEETAEDVAEEPDSNAAEECKMTVSIRLDLYRFDSTVNDFVFEETLSQVSNVEIFCDQPPYEGSTSWSYDRKASATTYKIIVETTVHDTWNDEDFPTISDVFVIWKSSGSPKGHAKRDLKKIDQVEKLITKLKAYYDVYETLWNAGLISGEERVTIRGQVMTVDEAVDMAMDRWEHAVLENNVAIEYFNTQDYETSFTKAKAAEREAHGALNIYHALLAQATRGPGQGK